MVDIGSCDLGAVRAIHESHIVHDWAGTHVLTPPTPPLPPPKILNRAVSPAGVLSTGGISTAKVAALLVT